MRIILGIALLVVIAAFVGDRAGVASAATAPHAIFQECSAAAPGSVRVTFVWEPSGQGEQWLDLTIGDDRFLPGTYTGVGPFLGTQWSYVWDGLLPDTVHVARVNMAVAGGWASTAAMPFLTPACAGASPASAFGVGYNGCEAAGNAFTFTWAPAVPHGVVQWVDLSIFDNGFAPGSFLSAGPLPATVAAHNWAGIAGNTWHYWRVNTWDGAQWRPGSVQAFRTPPCVVRQHTPGCDTDWGVVAQELLAVLPVADGICINRDVPSPFPACGYGCYDPNTREIWLPNDGPPRSDDTTVLHELCHVHQHHVVLPSDNIASWQSTAEGSAFIAAARQASADARAGLTPPVSDFAAEPVEGFAVVCGIWYLRGREGRPPLSVWPALEAFAQAWLPS